MLPLDFLSLSPIVYYSADKYKRVICCVRLTDQCRSGNVEGRGALPVFLSFPDVQLPDYLVQIVLKSKDSAKQSTPVNEWVSGWVIVSDFGDSYCNFWVCEFATFIEVDYYKGSIPSPKRMNFRKICCGFVPKFMTEKYPL